MKTERTFNTLFMISSLDGKISTGSIDARDVDKDFPNIPPLAKGLAQYYELEMKTDLHSLNTGRVMAKIGMNKRGKAITKCPASFVIIDNTHLTKTGVKNLLRKCQTLYLVTSNKNHPSFQVNDNHMHTLFYPKRIDFETLFVKLRSIYGIKRITIQSGGTLNASLIRAGLIDRVSLVIAPALIGGSETSTLVDGTSLRTTKDLSLVKTLRLISCTPLRESYIHLTYDVT